MQVLSIGRGEAQKKDSEHMKKVVTSLHETLASHQVQSIGDKSERAANTCPGRRSTPDPNVKWRQVHVYPVANLKVEAEGTRGGEAYRAYTQIITLFTPSSSIFTL